jgi:hypothetical protein
LIDTIEHFGIDSDDWRTLLAACNQIKELRHRIQNVEEAEKRILELADSQLFGFIRAFRRFFNVVKKLNWQFPDGKLIE